MEGGLGEGGAGIPSERQRRRVGEGKAAPLGGGRARAAGKGVGEGAAVAAVWPGANLASGSGSSGAAEPADASASTRRMPLRLMIQYLEAKWHVHGPDAEPAMDPGGEYAERLATQCGEAIERSEPRIDEDGRGVSGGGVWLPAQRMELEFVARRAPAKFRDKFDGLLASLGLLEEQYRDLQRMAGCAEWGVDEVAAEMQLRGVPAFVADAFVAERVDGACVLEMSELEVLQIVQHAKRLAEDGAHGGGGGAPSAGAQAWDFVRTCQFERKKARREALYASKLAELGENLQQQYASKHAEDPW